MPIELNPDDRAAAISSIKQYAEENFDDPLGDLGSGLLLDFFLEEVAPLVYNRAVVDAQRHMQARLAELDLEVHEEEFQFSRRTGRRQRGTT
jgi:uncharacterized protein (DUF2164 family)